MSEKTLKYGFTTGAAAAGAAKAAALHILKGPVEKIDIPSPANQRIKMLVKESRTADPGLGLACVVKDAGDDAPYDITHGLEIWSQVNLTDDARVVVLGGEGVGIVTKPGLPVGIGEPAINPAPRQMIEDALREVLPPGRGAEVTVSVPMGNNAAQKTLNSKLGIIKGISILGTTGIVTPKSLRAYRASLLQQIDVAMALGHKEIVLVPGNIGEKLAKQILEAPSDAVVQMGDYTGYMLKGAAKKGIEQIIMLGHPGKLVKIAASIFNTHHRVGDARMEVIAAHAGAEGAGKELVESILIGNTTETAVQLLKDAGLLHQTFNRIAKQISAKAAERIESKFKVRTVIVSLEGEVIGADTDVKHVKVETGKKS